MVTIYHNLDPAVPARMADPAFQAYYRPESFGLELAGIVIDTEDVAEAFDRMIHRDGENWTDNAAVTYFGDRRGRRSSQEGDVFVTNSGLALLALPVGFRPVPALKLPFLP